jgi:hypothetical protein
MEVEQVEQTTYEWFSRDLTPHTATICETDLRGNQKKVDLNVEESKLLQTILSALAHRLDARMFGPTKRAVLAGFFTYVALRARKAQ